jgi:hypothetical protein
MKEYTVNALLFMIYQYSWGIKFRMLRNTDNHVVRRWDAIWYHKAYNTFFFKLFSVCKWKFTNLSIHEIVICPQTAKICTHEYQRIHDRYLLATLIICQLCHASKLYLIWTEDSNIIFFHIRDHIQGRLSAAII